jgi:hypothetical protein
VTAIGSRVAAATGVDQTRNQAEPPSQGELAMTELEELDERLTRPGAVLYRTDLERLGYERRAVDAIFRELPVIVLPGYSRPIVRTSDYLALLERATYNEDKVRGR